MDKVLKQLLKYYLLLVNSIFDLKLLLSVPLATNVHLDFLLFLYEWFLLHHAFSKHSTWGLLWWNGELVEIVEDDI